MSQSLTEGQVSLLKGQTHLPPVIIYQDLNTKASGWNERT